MDHLLTIRATLKDGKITIEEDIPGDEQEVLVIFLGVEDDYELISKQEYRETVQKSHSVTDRELQVLRHAQVGMSNSEIAEKMKLSEGTVRNYLSSLYAKLDVDSRTEAIFKAVELKLLQPINDIDSCAQEHDLNDREIEVLALVQEGLTNQQIADRIQLSRGTIRNYLHYAYKKLDVNTRAEAVFRAVRLGILNAIDD